MDNAIKNGYTFAWGSDVSEQGFTRDGIAVMPDAARGAELTGSDMARWTGLTAADKRKELTGKPLPEVNVTQEMRPGYFQYLTVSFFEFRYLYRIRFLKWLAFVSEMDHLLYQ